MKLRGEVVEIIIGVFAVVGVLALSILGFWVVSLLAREIFGY